MDKNTIIGMVLIGALLLTWSIYNQPSKEQLALQKHVQDSIELVNQKTQKEETAKSAGVQKIIQNYRQLIQPNKKLQL